MKTKEAIQCLKSTFYKEFTAILEGTPFSIDLLAAIAYQETGYLWAPQIEKLSWEELLEICVGDTLESGRGAFPRTKAALLAAAEGKRMFQIAREALEHVGLYNAAYRKVADQYPNKFCHGYGIFQYDLQFFLEDPDFFLEKKWRNFGECLQRFVQELRSAQKRQKWQHKTSLTEAEQIYVAIAYNKGTANPSLGFKQGHQNKTTKRFYGENILEYLRIAQSVVTGTEVSHEAPLAAPTPIEAAGDFFVVDVRESPLRLRSEPSIPKTNPAANIVTRLPDGQIVHRLSGRQSDEFQEVETSLNGAYFRGFAATKYLVPATNLATVEVVIPAPTGTAPEIPAVSMPRKEGTITKRTSPAGALSLNEPSRPNRQGQTAVERVAELARIIAWLGVDNSTHKRYWPASGKTFCNIYAHDYCLLAGVYLPRVWWSQAAILKMGKGETVEPLYEKTIDELRANDLFRWLRDFGPSFGWRQTGTLTKLQEAANLGGIGLIVARRKIEGKSGHIVVVVPETANEAAKRDSTGNVISPLQSQAGATNFRYGTGAKDWWLGQNFADSAFWIHA